jgi:hypothetical protein
LILASVTDNGTIFLWANLLAQQWEVYAPSFRSLTSNEEYVESETEFDMNPKGGEQEERDVVLLAQVSTSPGLLTI